MNKKISLGVAIGLLCLVAAVSSVITMSAVSGQYNSLLKGLPEKLERYEILDELDRIINNNYYGNTDEDNLELAVAAGYVNSLGDQYSKFMTASEYSNYLAETQGDMSGIGIEYKKTGKSYIEITDVYDDSPAQNAGLAEGDVIIAFDGIPIDASNYSEMVEKLVGDKLTSVNLTYRRDKQDTTVNIVKGYEAESVSSQTYGNVGYLKISDFYSSTASKVKQAVESFTSSGIEAIVIDVRKNSSTNYSDAMEVLDIFVPMNDSSIPAASVVDEDGNVLDKYTTTSGEVNLPMAVLINEKTQAAAELFACNMRDFGKAELVGVSTGGIGLKRDVFTLSSGDAVLLSVGVVIPYRSESFNGVGLTPDLEADLTEKTKKIDSDSQFLAAVGLVAPDVQ